MDERSLPVLEILQSRRADPKIKWEQREQRKGQAEEARKPVENLELQAENGDLEGLLGMPHTI